MKIVLAEELSGQQQPEKSFEQKIIRIGRDSNNCDVFFANEKFPMVSRRHAQLIWENGAWILVDENSTYGTLINNQKIKRQKVAFGDALQFGENGPVLRVIWFELISDSIPPAGNAAKVKTALPQNPQISIPPAPAPAAPNNPKPPTQTPIPKQTHQTQAKETAKLELLVSGRKTDIFEINKNEIWLGRDPNCDITFDANAVMVSRRHARIVKQNDKIILHDNNSFNGILVNEQRVSASTPLYHDDEIRLGPGGPVLRFASPSRVAPKGASLAGQRAVANSQQIDLPDNSAQIGSQTMAINIDSIKTHIPKKDAGEPQLLMSLAFGGKNELKIGRAEDSDIQLDGLQISNRHAKLVRTNQGISIEDLNSTNGIYLNGTRVSRQTISTQDAVQIGSFLIKIDGNNNVGVFDTRSKTRIDSLNIVKDVKNRNGKGKIRLLDDISLSIQPNEFVGLLGPSGAGKSTLMDALNGMRPASGGSVLINNLDFYKHLDSLKQSIGYVPQDDIIHRELSVYKTLYYVAKLRLSDDVSKDEIDQIIDEVLDVTGIAEQRDVPINQLSGGQRKRVSIAVELITKPSVIFLDEPTSGLDPATEEKIMKLFRQIAESGRTVILTTHAMENVKLFDKIVVLMRGKLVFYGKPNEALEYLKADSFKDLYDRLESPINEKLKQNGSANRRQITAETAENWKQKFVKTTQYKKNVYEPLKQLEKTESGSAKKSHRLGIFGAIRQFFTLSRRYTEVLLRDKLTLFILLAQAPIIAVMTFLVMGENQPRDFVYFILSLVSVWFGTSVAAGEIVKEKPIYTRERMVNLGIFPYLASKLFVLGFIVFVQCFLLFAPLKLFHFAGLMKMPGEFFGIAQFWIVILTATVGIALGLLISALVKTSEMATSLVPLILIPQILFSGLIGVPTGINKIVGLTMPATWSFDTIKRYSGLDTLEAEGAYPNGETDGRGLYKSVEIKNDKIIADAKNDLEEYRKDVEQRVDDYIRRDDKSAKTKLDDPPKIADAEKIPEDLSDYISFLHPWMHTLVNQIVLLLMFGGLFVTTLIVLRLKDIS